MCFVVLEGLAGWEQGGTYGRALRHLVPLLHLCFYRSQGLSSPVACLLVPLMSFEPISQVSFA